MSKEKWKRFGRAVVRWVTLYPLFAECCLVIGSFVSGQGGGCQLELVRPEREEVGKPRGGEVGG